MKSWFYSHSSVEDLVSRLPVIPHYKGRSVSPGSARVVLDDPGCLAWQERSKGKVYLMRNDNINVGKGCGSCNVAVIF